jgi:hypothetical protein
MPQKTNKNYFTYPLYIQNNNGTGPETSNQGAFGVKSTDENGNLILEGEKSKIELGFLLTGFINKKY